MGGAGAEEVVEEVEAEVVRVEEAGEVAVEAVVAPLYSSGGMGVGVGGGR